MNADLIFFALFALCSISVVNGACTTTRPEEECKSFCGQYNVSANLGSFYMVAVNSGNPVPEVLKCLKLTFCAGSDSINFEAVIQAQFEGVEQVFQESINISSTCPNQRTVFTEGDSILSGYQWLQAINWVDNSYASYYSCQKTPSSLNEVMGLLVKKDQLENIEKFIEEANAKIEQSVFSSLRLFKIQDIESCFP